MRVKRILLHNFRTESIDHLTEIPTFFLGKFRKCSFLVDEETTIFRTRCLVSLLTFLPIITAGITSDMLRAINPDARYVLLNEQLRGRSTIGVFDGRPLNSFHTGHTYPL